MNQFIVLRRGSTGKAVNYWQLFLIGQKFLDGEAYGIFGLDTDKATQKYQAAKGLKPNGIVCSQTYARAIQDGFPAVEDDLEFPPKPNFQPLVDIATRQKLFGKFDFVSHPIPGNRENIEILGNWEAENIITVSLPSLKSIDTFGQVNLVKTCFHKLAAPQLEGLWAAWQAKKLIKFILTFDSSFVPRFQRGSKTKLSNHAFGSAFDINASYNSLGQTPALVGKKGSVRELVPTANEYGFYWGGHFNTRKDGMHFEVAKILTEKELQALRTKFN